VDGTHADARQVLGRTLHLSERLESALEAAHTARAGLMATAAGWRAARPGRRDVPDAMLLEGLEEDQADALERSPGA